MSYINETLKAGVTPDSFAGVTAPWHKVWNELDEATARDFEAAKTAGGLNWGLKKDRLVNPFTGKPISEHYAICRDDNDECIGVVKERYTPVDNHQAFAFLQDMLDADQNVLIDSCGSFKGGAFVFANARILNGDFEVVKGDTHQSYVQFITSHDGSLKFQTFESYIRMVCGNTARFAMNQAKANGALFSFRHTKKSVDAIENAKEWLAIVGMERASFIEKAKFLTTKRTTKETATEFLYKLLDFTEEDKKDKFSKNDPNKLKGNRKKTLFDVIMNADGADGIPGIEGTFYDLFNRVTKASDHLLIDYAHAKVDKGVTKETAHAFSTTFGSMADRKTDAFELALQFANKA